MKVRATIVVKGDVQEAGYRAFIMKTAQKLKLVGFVENLPDGSVRIICEGSKSIIGDFCKKIRIKNDMIEVESLRRYYSKPRDEFKRFEVKTGDIAYEMFQGYATAGKYFKSLGGKVDDLGENLGNKMDDLGEGVGEKIDSMHQDMNVRFDNLDSTYGKFSEKIDSLDNTIKELKDDFKLLVHHFVDKEKKKSE